MLAANPSDGTDSLRILSKIAQKNIKSRGIPYELTVKVKYYKKNMFRSC